MAKELLQTLKGFQAGWGKLGAFFPVVARDVTLTRNGLFSAYNSREQFILALVKTDGDQAGEPRYVQGFAFQEPAHYAEAVKVNLKVLVDASTAPR